MSDFTFLTHTQVSRMKRERILKKRGNAAKITDLAILLGGDVQNGCFDIDNLKDRTGLYWTSDYIELAVIVVDFYNSFNNYYEFSRNVGSRPIVKYSSICDDVTSNKVVCQDKVVEIEYGEYPQYASDECTQRRLESEYQNRRLQTTGKNYTFDSTQHDNYSQSFQAVTYDEYKHEGRKYVRVEARLCNDNVKLSNGKRYDNGNYVWVEVSPIKWLVDEKKNLAISDKILFAGVQYNCSRLFRNDFENTDIKKYLDEYFAKDIIPSKILSNEKDVSISNEKNTNKQISFNPYHFAFDKVNEEDLIKGLIKSNVPVLLHGKDPEVKVKKIKKLDPNYLVLYLKNNTIDSLSGKSQYNYDDKEMINVKPMWLIKLEEKCLNEPDRLHILYLENITESKPKIQDMVFNIILDKKVNGIWKLPDNVRIIASDYEKLNLLKNNKINKRIFSNLGHVNLQSSYDELITISKEEKLTYQKEEEQEVIHPAIYTYLMYNQGKDKLETDLNRWQLASKILYTTNNPKMLASLFNEGLVADFCNFCTHNLITLNDVLYSNYLPALDLTKEEILESIIGLTQVGEEEIDKVWYFVYDNFGKDYCSLFYSKWARGQADRLIELELLDNTENEEKLQLDKQLVKKLVRTRN